MKYQAYPKYKDSGVEWLGKIPEEWQLQKINSVVSKITNGYVGPTRDILHDSGIRYLQSLHIKRNQILFDEPYFVSEEWSNAHSKSILKENDVLVVQTGDLGQIARVTKEFEGCNCHALIILTPKQEKIRGEFLSQFLTSSLGFYFLLSNATGALLPHLNCGNVREIFLPLPPLPTQISIAQFLDTETAKIDRLIAENSDLIALLQEKRKALISHAVTRGLSELVSPDDPEFGEWAKPVTFKDSGVEWLGMVPEGWEVKKLKYVKSEIQNAFVDGPFGSNLKSEHFIENGDVYVIESNFATQGLLIQDELKTISSEHFETIKRSEVKEDDIVIAKIGAQFGKASILPKINKKAVVSGNSLKLTVNNKICDTSWIHLFLTHLKSNGQIDLIENSSAQPALSMGSMNNLYFLVPDKPFQTAIVRFLELEGEKHMELINQTNISIELLKEHRSSLITNAVTGKIKVD